MSPRREPPRGGIPRAVRYDTNRLPSSYPNRHLHLVIDAASSKDKAEKAITTAANAVKAWEAGNTPLVQVLESLIEAGSLAHRAQDKGWPHLAEKAA